MKSGFQSTPGNDSNSDATPLDQNGGDEIRHYGQPSPQQANRPELSKKRKRTMHACDECRRKKKSTCTYDDPSKRGRIVSPRQVEAIETRLERAERLLRILEPSLDLNDLYLSTNKPERIAAMLRQQTPDSDTNTRQNAAADDTIDDSLLWARQWNYNGQSSTTIFMQRLQNQFGNLIAPIPTRSRSKLVEQILGEPLSDIGKSQSSIHSSPASVNCDLPPESRARQLCQLSFDEACICYHFVHKPSFWTLFDQIYATTWDNYGAEERVFLPLFYAVLSVGCLFSSTEHTTTNESAVMQGLQYFRACRALLDLTDCRDLTSLQAILFMILFLQSSTQLIACYPYIGIAQRAPLRLGLHRKIQGNFDPIQRELRKRIFWTVYSMDVYISTRLGLPIAIHDEDIDQEYPLEMDDEFITTVGVVPMPPGRVSAMIGVNAHTRLLDIIVQVMKHIYPIELAKLQGQPDNTYMISYSKIRDIEASLQEWIAGLPSALQSQEGSHSVSTIWERMSHLLRLAHAHGFQAEGLDKRLYMCADACVGASRNIIDITRDMHTKGLLRGAHWFPMHTTYFATLTLIYPILEDKQVSPLKLDAVEGAFEGMNVLEALAKNGLAVERCPRLPSLFKYLPEKIYSPNGQTGNVDSALDRSNLQQAIAPSEQSNASQEDSDLMRMFLPPDFGTAQMDNFDEILIHFGMDIFDMNNHC
ncbi:hypothetical protein GGI43DRAFT_423177 [Trichoderma evansii]